MCPNSSERQKLSSLRIIYIDYVRSKEGYATLDVFTPLKELAKRGDVAVLISKNDGTSYYSIRNENGGVFRVFPILPPRVRTSSALLSPLTLYLSSFELLYRINRIIRATKPHFLLSSSDYSLPLLSFLLSKMNKIPLILTFREMHLELFALLPNHNIFVTQGAKFLSRLNQLVYRRVQHSIAIFEGFEVFLRAYMNLTNVTTIDLMCYDLEESPRAIHSSHLKKLISNPTEITILYAGSIRPERRLDVLVDAFSKIASRNSTVRLLIAGNGELEKLKTYVKKNVEPSITQRIHLLGSLPRDEVLALLRLVDVCVDPFPCKDWTASTKLIEYMVYGKCVITTDCFKNRFYIKNKFNGLLFRSNDVSDLVNCLESVLGDDTLRTKIGKNARETINEKFNVKKVVPLFRDFCLQAVLDFENGMSE